MSTEREIAGIIADALRKAGIAALITGGRISADLPNGECYSFVPLDMDTERADGVAVMIGHNSNA